VFFLADPAQILSRRELGAALNQGAFALLIGGKEMNY